jgi:exopolysaccharide biosynthesis polyprenyl glycosylphosphotransferase
MEGSKTMQPHLEDDMPTVSRQSSQDREVSVANDNLPQMAESVVEKQQSQVGGLQGQEQRRQKRPSETTLRLILLIGDGVLLLASLLLVLILEPMLHIGLNILDKVLGLWDVGLVGICLVLVSWSIAANITRVQHLNCASSLLKGPLYALSALMLTLIFCTLFLYLFIGRGAISYTKPLLFFLVVAVPIFSVWRVVVAKVLSLPRFRRQAVIVGVNATGEIIARELERVKHLGINILGYISESLDVKATETGLPILGDKTMLRYLARNSMIDMIIMALDYKANPEPFHEAFGASQLGISVVPMPVIYERTSGKIALEHIGDQWYVALQKKWVISPFYLCWRKMLDLAFGFCGLLLLCLVLPILAPLIYLDSPGPIFFSQERAGYRGRTFRIFKFRSMSTDAGRVKHAAWVTKGDTRITRVGRILRATHLDELPQVLNILRGDMSLIGPRPERPEFVAELEKENSLYGYRLSVKPGLTGWAQVNYGYGSTQQDELIKLQYDLYYIKHQSFLFDVLIILKTAMEVMFCHGV